MLKRHWRSVFILVALCIDALAIGGSGLVAYFLRENVFDRPPMAAFELFIVVLYSGSILIGMALILGLYRASFHTNILHQSALAAKAYILGASLALASFYFLQWYDLPRVFTTSFFALVPAAFVVGRILLRRFTVAMQKHGFGWYRTLVIENGGSGPYFFRKLEILPELGYEIVAVASWNGAFAIERNYTLIDVACCHTRDELRELIRNKAVERVLLPTVDLKQETISDIFEVCKDARVKLKLLSHESEELLRFSYVKDVAGITLYSSPRRKIERAKRLTKRILDLVGGSLITLLFSPILLSAAFAILIEDGRPVLYRQRRALAKGKKEFDVFKFRTMVKDAEKQQADLYQKNLVSGGLFLMKHDPRLLKVGKLLRKFSMDELPQLFNVLKGEMSLVGPRPLSVADLDNITPSNRLGGYYELRANALPGMTGLWQISGRREISFKEMVLLDLYYIENQSVMFDLEILFATIPVVLFGKGAY